MIGTPPPNRDRFLAAIAERVAPERVQALFLFAPIRQGQLETGVAVLSVDQPIVLEPVAVSAEANAEANAESNAEANAESNAEPSMPPQHDANAHAPETLNPNPEPPQTAPETRNPRPVTPLVLTARYRHTLKGPDRGKWELEILEQADAPLVTVEMVVRGVQQRLDDASDPERIGADELRAALAVGLWTAPQR